MQLFKRTQMLIIVLVMALFAVTAIPAQAASARVRCRVDRGRVRIQVDGIGLLPGAYFAVVKNMATGATDRTDAGKERTATALAPNVDLDFDSTAQANDLDSNISATFAQQGQTVRATVKNKATGVTAATASTVCSR